MAADSAFKDEVMELLTPVGDITCKSMFGGYGIFHEGAMFALISGSTLYLKVNDSNRASFESAGSEQFAHMPYYRVPDPVYAAASSLTDWAKTSVAIAHAQPPRKRRKR